MSLFSESEYDGLLPVEETVERPAAVERSSFALVTIACAAAVAFALVGAALAVDGTAAAAGTAARGDRLAEAVAPGPTMTVEDANLDAGFSNLTLLPSAPSRVALR